MDQRDVLTVMGVTGMLPFHLFLETAFEEDVSQRRQLLTPFFDGDEEIIDPGVGLLYALGRHRILKEEQPVTTADLVG